MKEIAISIRIWHPHKSTNEISTIMRCKPNIAHSVGEQRMTPVGKKLEGLYTESYWSKKIDADKLQLLGAIEKALKIIQAVPGATQQITKEGGRVEFFIGWFVDRNSGEELSHELLGELSDLNIDLSFDIYGAELKSKSEELT